MKRVIRNLLKLYSPNILLIAAATIAFSGCTNGQIQANTSSEPSEILSLSSEEIEFQDIPIGDNTVSFTEDGRVVYLRYRGKVYSQQNEGDWEPPEVPIAEEDYSWQGLIDAPQGLWEDAEFNRLFSFKVVNGSLTDDRQGFVFVMRWTTQTENILNQIFKSFYFNGLEVRELNPTEKASWGVPKIGDISTDGMRVVFDMHFCWNCESRKPETIVVNLETGVSESLGLTLQFRWGENGNYTYKEYIVKDCDPPTELPDACFEDPETLDQISGQI